MAPKSAVVGIFTHKKVTNGNQHHFSGNSPALRGGVYLTRRDLAQLHVSEDEIDTTELEVVVRVKS